MTEAHDTSAEKREDDLHVVMSKWQKDVEEIWKGLGNNPSNDTCKELEKKAGDLSKDLQYQRKRIDNYGLVIRSDPLEVTVSGSQKVKNQVKSRNCYSFFAKKEIQILNPIITAITEQFSSALKIRMSDFESTLLSEDDPVVHDKPLIVVCQLSGRLESDVKATLKSVKYSSEYVVILLHTGVESSLPPYSSEKHLERNNVIFVDMGFNKDTGFMKCQLNNDATKQLRSYIKQFKEHE